MMHARIDFFAEALGLSTSMTICFHNGPAARS